MLEALRIVKEALPHAHVGQPREHFSQHVPESILTLRKTALPMRFQHDEPSESRLRLKSPSVPGRPAHPSAGTPPARECATLVAQLEMPPAGSAGLSVTKLKSAVAQLSF